MAPPMIKSEAGMLLINVPVDIETGLDIGTYVKNAQAEIDRARTDGRLEIPPGYHLKWSGQFEFMEQVRQRLNIIIPITLALIFILIYFNMKNITETLITMFTLPFALIGGVWGVYWLGYNWSVAVAIGFIALAGLAAETGIIMHVYLDLAYKKHRREKGRALTPKELYDAVIEGAVFASSPETNDRTNRLHRPHANPLGHHTWRRSHETYRHPRYRRRHHLSHPHAGPDPRLLHPLQTLGTVA